MFLVKAMCPSYSTRWPQEWKHTLLGTGGRRSIRHGGNSFSVGRQAEENGPLGSKENGKERYQMKEMGRPKMCLKPESQAEKNFDFFFQEAKSRGTLAHYN